MQENSTINLLRSLHDLDLGAHAYNTRITGEPCTRAFASAMSARPLSHPLTPADLDVLCAAYTAHPSGYRAVLTATLGHNDAPSCRARELAALGAKVRAALPQEPNPLQNALDRMQRALDCEKQSRAVVLNVLDQVREGLGWKAGGNDLSTLARTTREQVDNARQALADLRGDQVSTAPLADQIRALPTVVGLHRPDAPGRPVVVLPPPEPAVPRVLQSADEAPCGSLIHGTDIYGTQGHTLRLWNGNGWNVIHGGGLRHKGEGWPWGTRANGPATLLAEGLTEDECRHLSGLSAADAVAWCEKRQAPLHVGAMCKENAETLTGAHAVKRPQPGDVVPWGEVEDGCLYTKDWGSWGPSQTEQMPPTLSTQRQRYEITLDKVRQELGASPGDDIVAHARKVKARAVENERMLASLAEITATADCRLSLMLDADERDSRIRDALGACETESIEDAIRRVMHEHELDLKAAAFEIKHLRDERDVARAQVDSLRRHSDPDRPPEF